MIDSPRCVDVLSINKSAGETTQNPHVVSHCNCKNKHTPTSCYGAQCTQEEKINPTDILRKTLWSELHFHQKYKGTKSGGMRACVWGVAGGGICAKCTASPSYFQVAAAQTRRRLCVELVFFLVGRLSCPLSAEASEMPAESHCGP